ncbi:hypothetical protein DFH29DRAFT_997191 [Suillus ampliporus]|nr:hypothetical protein DFH29DRAFT_997191 [Suillus ampliporus]
MPSLWKFGLGFLSVEPDGVPHVDASVLITESGLQLNAGDMTFRSGLVHMDEIVTKNGKLYLQGEEPLAATNKFWYQHFAPYEEGGSGRVMIEFYDQERIVAIFKSNDDDVGTGGTGIWVQN